MPIQTLTQMVSVKKAMIIQKGKVLALCILLTCDTIDFTPSLQMFTE
jgi:hypothetical protein